MKRMLFVQSFDQKIEAQQFVADKLIKGLYDFHANGNKVYFAQPYKEDPDLWFYPPQDPTTLRKRIPLNDPKTIIVQDVDDLLYVREQLIKHEYFSYDLETTGLDHRKDGIVGFGCCWGLSPEQTAYIPIGHWVGQNIDHRLFIKTFKPVLENDWFEKCAHNGKFDNKFLRSQLGIKVRGLIFDSILAHWLLNCRTKHPHAIDQAIEEYAQKNVVIPSYSDLIKEIPRRIKHKSIGDLSPERVGYYCGLDCYMTFMLAQETKKDLEKDPALKKIFHELEMPVLEILTEMELLGLQLDPAWYKERIKEMPSKIKEINDQAGKYKEGINLGSTVQLNRFLFKELKLPTNQLKQNKQGYSLDKDALKVLKGTHSIIDLIQEHRKIIKVFSTYVRPIWNERDKSNNKLYPSFNQIGTVTGRLSCNNPNGQNFPTPCREGIIAPEGYVLGSIDYSGCEYRLLSHLSKCEYLINGYLNGNDAHTMIAKLFFPNRDPKEIWMNGKNFRWFGKQLNFSVVYGQHVAVTAEKINATVEETKAKYDLYWSNLPEVKTFQEYCYRKAIACGYSETILGRKRFYDFRDQFYIQQRGFPIECIDLKKNNHPDDAEIFRQCFNATIQGSNADITKLAMIACDHFFRKTGMKTVIILQIHDELVFQIPIGEIDQWQENIPRLMSNVYKLSIPLDVDARIGKNWMEIKG